MCTSTATTYERPYGTGAWALYDLARGPAEARDLAAHKPDLVAELRQQWVAYEKRVGVVLPRYNLGPSP